MTSDAVDAVRRSSPSRAARLRASRSRRPPTAVTEICETLDGLPLGIELAAARMAAMSAVEVRDRLADRFRLLQGSTPGPERQLTLRHAVEWSYDLLTDDERDLLRLTSVFAGGFDLTSICAVVDGADDVDVLRHLDSLVRKSLVVADHTATRTRYRLFETIRQFAEDRLAEAGALEPTRDRHAEYFAREAARRDGSTGTGPGGATRSTGWRRSSATCAPAYQWSAGRGDAGGGDRHRRARRADGLLGAAVRNAGLGRGAARRRPTAADVRRLPRLYTAAGYACFAGRAEAARVNAHRATELEVDSRYDACEPGYASFVEALGQRVLRRPRSLRRADRSGGASATEAIGATAWPSYVDGLQSCGRIEEALALTEESVAAARSLGNPYWISYALWIAGMAFSKADVRRAFAAWDEGVAFGTRAPRPVLRGLPRPRRGSPAHLRRRGRGRAGALRRCHRGVPAGRQRAPADHHARQRARAVRAPGPSCARGDAARRAVS